MPIPTRSQSVSKRMETGLTIRKPSAQVRTESSGGQNVAIQPTSEAPHGLGDQNAPSHAPQGRGSVRSKVELSKPGTHTRATSISHTSNPVTRTPVSRINNASVAEIKKSSGLRQPSAILNSKPQTRSQTRSATGNNLQAADTASTRLVRPGSLLHKETQATRHIRAAGKAPTEIPDHSLGQDVADIRSRDELLQLQILHVSSARILASYKDSIEQVKAGKAEGIRRQQEETIQHESRHRQAVSSTSLRSWFSENVEYSDEQQIHILSAVIAELDHYTNNPQQLQPLRDFESWLSNATAIRENRREKVDHELRFIAALGGTWRAEMAQLQSDVSRVLNVLSHLKPVMAYGGLGILLEKHIAFSSLLLQEIEAAISLESSLVNAESQDAAQSLEKALQDLAEAGMQKEPKVHIGAWMQQ